MGLQGIKVVSLFPPITLSVHFQALLMGILRSALVISFIIYQKIKQINRFGL